MVTFIEAVKTQSVTKLIYIVISIGLLLIVPGLTQQQLIVGALVNAILLLTAVYVGPFEAALSGLIPSIVALSSGTLPLVLAPVLPFIMAANAVYVYVFSRFKSKQIMIAVIAASLVKFGLLYFSAHYIVSGLLQEAVASKAIIMMSWPQLVTAVLGGVIATQVMKWKKNT